MPFFVSAQTVLDEIAPADAYIFVRDDCAHCQDLKAFMKEHDLEGQGYTVSLIDIAAEPGKTLFDEATTVLGTGKVTPISLIDGQVYVGFAEEVVGQKLIDHVAHKERKIYTFASYLREETSVKESGAGCEEGSLVPCAQEEEPVMIIPVLGAVDPHAISLTLIAVILGFVDGFNPCAMWVLLTFLLILSQVGDRKKMIQVAGLFIFAEAVMYYLILNVWYQTWDFVALDRIVTPAVGLLAVGSGIFFLYRYWTTRNQPLTCDVTSIESQQKTEHKIQKLVSKPMSIMVALAIIGLALSVNVIEFACSIGIPQAFTKILELNQLHFVQYQGYTLLYTLFYMVDDILVFALATWGYQKFYAVGQKYSRMSTLVAGVLMLAIGLILLFVPNILF